MFHNSTTSFGRWFFSAIPPIQFCDCTRNQIAPVMCAAFTQRKLVMNLLHWNQNSSLVALLTERMLCSILITNPFPCTTISSLRIFISSVFLIITIYFVRMLFTVPPGH